MVVHVLGLGMQLCFVGFTKCSIMRLLSGVRGLINHKEDTPSDDNVEEGGVWRWRVCVVKGITPPCWHLDAQISFSVTVRFELEESIRWCSVPPLAAAWIGLCSLSQAITQCCAADVNVNVNVWCCPTPSHGCRTLRRNQDALALWRHGHGFLPVRGDIPQPLAC